MRTISRLGVASGATAVLTLVSTAAAFAGGCENVTPIGPSVAPPSCTHPSEVVTTTPQTGVSWAPAANVTLTPGQSVTMVATATGKYMIASGVQTSWTFTNDFRVKTCAPAPVRLPYGHVAVSCGRHVAATIGNRAKANKDVTFHLRVGKRRWAFIVRPGHKRTVEVRAAHRRDKVVLGALGKTLDTGRSIGGACAPTPTRPPSTGL